MNMIKPLIPYKLIFAFIILACPIVLKAQVTAVSATVTDSDGQAWNNGKWSVTFVPNPNYPNINSYNINGVQLNSSTYNSYLSQSGVLNGSAAFSVNLLDNNLIAPTGTTWRFTITPNASVPATVYPNVAVSTASMSLTSFLSSNATPIRFPAGGYGSYGYADTEISINPLPGGFYWRVTDSVQRLWTGSAWVSNAQSVSTAYCLLTGCTYTGGISGPTATFTYFGGTGFTATSYINTPSLLINSVPISAANLSNGVSGTGAVCLASGSACSPTSAITSLSFSSSNTQLTITPTPANPCVTSTCAFALALATTGSGVKVVTATAAGTDNQMAVWSSGNLTSQVIPTVPTIQAVKVTSGFCTTANSAYSNCSFSVNWPASFSTTNYAVTCTSSPGSGTNAILTGLFINNRTDTGFTVILQNGDASGAGATTITELNCIGTLTPGNG